VGIGGAGVNGGGAGGIEVRGVEGNEEGVGDLSGQREVKKE
jgi:hypothetical protein